MTDLVRLGLIVDSQGFVRAKRDIDGFRKSAADTTKQTDGMGKTMSSTNTIAAAFGRTLGLISASLATSGIFRYADAWTNVENRLKIVTDSTAALAAATEGVVQVALRSHAALEETASLYSTLARYAGDLVDSDEELLRITETLNKSFAVSGAGAAEQAGAIRQLSQALASGALRGDEFNSINENAPRIMDAVARSLNMTKGELREFAATGGITAEIVINAVSGMADEIDADFASMNRTMAQFWENASTNITQFIGSSRSVQDVVQVFGSGIVLLSENLDVMADAAVALSTVLGARFVASLAASAQETIKKIAVTRAHSAALVENARINAAAAQAEFAAASAAAARVPGFYLNAAALEALTAAEQRAAAATAAHTAAMRSAAGAAGVLRGAYALIGGPVGAAVIAATGLYLFLTRAKEAAAPTLDLSQSVDQLTESFRELGIAQREQARIDLATKLAEANDKLARAQKALAEASGEQVIAHEGFVTTFRLTEEQVRKFRIQAEKAEAEVRRLTKAMDAVEELDLDLKTSEFLKYNGWVETATDAQDAYNQALEQTNQIIPIALRNYERMVQMQADEAFREISQALAEERAALHMTNAEQDIYNFLKSEAAQKMLPEQRQAIIEQIEALHAEREALAALAGTSTETAESMGDDVRVFGTAWDRGVERMRDVIGDFFQRMLVDGDFTFRSLLDAFKRMLAEMIATAAANRVMIGLGLTGASGAALGSTGGASALGGLSGGLGSVLTSLEGMFAKAGIQSGASFMYGLQSQFANAGSMLGGGMATGAALTAGAGILGGIAGQKLGSALFGKRAESVWGASLGGIAGAAIAGPIGAAIGAALGGALDSLFGGDGKKRVTLGVETDPTLRAGGRGLTGTQVRGASGILYSARATRADEEAANSLAQSFAGIDNALTAFTEMVTGSAVRLSGPLRGKSSQAGLSVQDSGINSFFGSAAFNELSEAQLLAATGEFINAWLDAAERAIGDSFRAAGLVRQYSGDLDSMLAFIDAFGQLLQMARQNPVQAALDAQSASSLTMLEVYQRTTGVVRDLAASYDGSIAATQDLSAALAVQQDMAYQLATAYLQVQQQVDGLFGGLSESIRMSLMSQEELYNYERERVHALTALLETMTDPASILNTAQEIERRVSQMWGRLDEEQRQVMGPDFLAFIDSAAQSAQARLAAGLSDLESTQADVNETIRQGIEDAASRMASAAAMQQAAVAQFGAYVQQFGGYTQGREVNA